MRRNKAGFTLIEVLVALTIIAIAFFAILSTNNTNILHTQRLEDKITAQWVALDVLRHIQINPKAFKASRTETLEMLNQRWIAQALKQKTANTHIDRINVTVLKKSNHQPYATLIGFIKHDA